MSSTHTHLLLNHIPVTGIFFSSFLLLFGLLRRSKELQSAALLACVLIALATIPVFLTGNSAESAVERSPEVSQGFIAIHKGAARISFWATQVLGIAAALGLVLLRRVAPYPRWFAETCLLVAIGTCGLMVWTAVLGGQIRHSEISAGAVATDADASVVAEWTEGE